MTMTAESSTYTYESGAQETVTLSRGPATPSGHALLTIAYSDGEITDCYVDLAWLRDRLDDLDPRPLTPDDMSGEELRKRTERVQADVLRAHREGRADWARIAVFAALAEPPPRPEGAEKVEAVLHQYWSGDINGDDLADRIAEEMNR